jgi:anti-sigma factor ChrR (cupin superfamily)
MMTQKIDEELELKATLHALGTMTQNEARAFEESLEDLDAANQSELESFDDVVHLLGLAVEEEAPSPAVWEKLSAIMAAEPNCVEATREAPIAEVADEPQLALDEVKQAAPPALLTIRRDEGEWHQLSEGIFVKPMFQNQQQGTSSYMVKMIPGARFDLHRHRGVEECMMIEGDFHVDGQVLGPGDYHCALPGSIHERPFTVGGNLFLVVSSAMYESLEDHVS